MPDSIETFLPGTLVIEPGSARDYDRLAHFHYVPRRPATWAGVWRIVYDDARERRVVAVGCLSYPTISCHARDRALGLRGLSRAQRIDFVNAHVRTISRVIVHPQFRALGLASQLVRHMIRESPTRYLEAMATMGHAHPFFEAAGLRAQVPTDAGAPVYFWIDRQAHAAPAAGAGEVLMT